jgi:hypothetical protein
LLYFKMRVALAAGHAGAEKQAEKARAEFEAVKADKQPLKPFPSELQSLPRVAARTVTTKT